MKTINHPTLYFIFITITLLGCNNSDDKCNVELGGFTNAQAFSFTDEELIGKYVITRESIQDLPDSVSTVFDFDSIFVKFSDHNFIISDGLKKLVFTDNFYHEQFNISAIKHGTWEEVSSKNSPYYGISMTYLNEDDQIVFIQDYNVLSTNNRIPVLAFQSPFSSDDMCGILLLQKQ